MNTKISLIIKIAFIFISAFFLLYYLPSLYADDFVNTLETPSYGAPCMARPEEEACAETTIVIKNLVKDVDGKVEKIRCDPTSNAGVIEKSSTICIFKLHYSRDSEHLIKLGEIYEASTKHKICNVYARWSKIYNDPKKKPIGINCRRKEDLWCQHHIKIECVLGYNPKISSNRRDNNNIERFGINLS